jgi:hypothetical protein
VRYGIEGTLADRRIEGDAEQRLGDLSESVLPAPFGIRTS